MTPLLFLKSFSLGFLSTIAFGCHSFTFWLCPLTIKTTLLVNEQLDSSLSSSHTLSVFLRVWREIYLTVFIFGLGTSIGELPPFLVSRMTRLAAAKRNAVAVAKAEKDAPAKITKAHSTKEAPPSDDDNDSLCNDNNSIHNDKHTESSPPAAPIPQISPFGSFSSDALVQQIQAFAEAHQIIAFFGILTLASVPNPLFDCAGILCGYTQVPAHVFLIATIIGKTFVKMSLQISFIIFMFSASGFSMLEHYSTKFLPSKQAIMVIDFVHKQRHSIQHVPSAEEEAQKAVGGILSMLTVGNVCNAIMVIMVSYMALNVLLSAYEHARLMRKQGHAVLSLHSLYQVWCSDEVESGGVVEEAVKEVDTHDEQLDSSGSPSEENFSSSPLPTKIISGLKSCCMESMDSLCTADTTQEDFCELITSSQ